jgi:hypothetical protein
MRTIFPKVGWMLAGVLALYVLSALAGVVSGSRRSSQRRRRRTSRSHSFRPHDAAAGFVERRRGGCNSSRFSCVMHDGVEYTAVLDGETG